LIANINIRAVITALIVAGLAFWWYYEPLHWFGAIIAAIGGVFTYFIIKTKRKQNLHRSLFISLFVIFLVTLLMIVYIDNNLSSFIDWAAKHKIDYYEPGETLRSTIYPCTLVISQVFLGRAATFFPSTGSWLVTFPPSLNAFLWVMVPFAATILIFGRSFCGWICPFGGLPEAMVTGKKERWQLNFLKKRVGTASILYYADIKEWVRDLKYGVLFASILLAFLAVVPIVCLLCPVLWIMYMPTFWIIIGLMIVFAILLPFMSKKRWWCHICPLGAFLAMFNRISLFRVRIDKNKCDKCFDCANECRMYALTPDIVSKTYKPNEDCIRCGRCIENCPQDAIEMYFPATSLRNRNLLIFLAIIAILAWYTWFVFILLGKINNIF